MISLLACQWQSFSKLTTKCAPLRINKLGNYEVAFTTRPFYTTTGLLLSSWLNSSQNAAAVSLIQLINIRIYTHLPTPGGYYINVAGLNEFGLLSCTIKMFAKCFRRSPASLPPPRNSLFVSFDTPAPTLTYSVTSWWDFIVFSIDYPMWHIIVSHV